MDSYTDTDDGYTASQPTETSEYYQYDDHTAFQPTEPGEYDQYNDQTASQPTETSEYYQYGTAYDYASQAQDTAYYGGDQYDAPYDYAAQAQDTVYCDGDQNAYGYGAYDDQTVQTAQYDDPSGGLDYEQLPTGMYRHYERMPYFHRCEDDESLASLLGNYMSQDPDGCGGDETTLRDGVYYPTVLPVVNGTRLPALWPSQILVESFDASYAAAEEALWTYVDSASTEPLRVHADVSEAFVEKFLSVFTPHFDKMVEFFLVTDNSLTTARVFKALQDVRTPNLVRFVQRTRVSEYVDPGSKGIDEKELCLGTDNRLASLRHLATDSARWIFSRDEPVNLNSLQTLILNKLPWGPYTRADLDIQFPHLEGQQFIHALASTPNLVNLSIYQWVTQWGSDYASDSIQLPYLRYLRMDRSEKTAKDRTVLSCADFLHLLAPTPSLRVLGFRVEAERFSFNTESRPDLFPPGYDYRNYYTTCTQKFPYLRCLSLQAGGLEHDAWSRMAHLFGDGITHLALSIGPSHSEAVFPIPFVTQTLKEDWTSVTHLLVLSAPRFASHILVYLDECERLLEVLMGPLTIKCYDYRSRTGSLGWGLTEEMVKDIRTGYSASWEFPIEAVDYRERLGWGEDGWDVFADDLDFCK